MALVLNGISVSRGLAIGKAHRLQRIDLEVNEYIVPKPLLGEEITRFRVAVKKAKQQLRPFVAAFLRIHPRISPILSILIS